LTRRPGTGRLLAGTISLLLAGACGAGLALPETTQPPRVVPFAFDFARGTQGWTAEFSDYPPGQEAFFELTAESRPAPVRGTESLYISGNNHSDDLFMFFKREVTGLRPNTLYQVSFVVDPHQSIQPAERCQASVRSFSSW
jgi:hypothetical protein